MHKHARVRVGVVAYAHNHGRARDESQPPAENVRIGEPAWKLGKARVHNQPCTHVRHPAAVRARLGPQRDLVLPAVLALLQRLDGATRREQPFGQGVHVVVREARVQGELPRHVCAKQAVLRHLRPVHDDLKAVQAPHVRRNARPHSLHDRFLGIHGKGWVLVCAGVELWTDSRMFPSVRHLVHKILVQE